MACHLIGEKSPSTYNETAAVLKQIEVLKEDEAKLIQKIIGSRNIVVHGYATISLSLVEKY